MTGRVIAIVVAGSMLVHVPFAAAQAPQPVRAEDPEPSEEPDEPDGDEDGGDEDGEGQANADSSDGGDQGGSDDGTPAADGQDDADTGPDFGADEPSRVSRPRFAEGVEIVDDGTAVPDESDDEQIEEPAPPVTYKSDPEARARGKRAAERRAQAAEGGSFGGYFNSPEDPERAPQDGERNLLIGTILLPLGSLQLAGGILTAILGMQPRCSELFDYSDSSCNGMVGYGATGASLGGLMAITGAVFLGIGLSQRGNHRRWKRQRGQAARLRVGGTGLVFRF